MRGKKTKIPNIIKKHIDVIDTEKIGTQPSFNRPSPKRIRKPPLPTNKDLFYVNGKKDEDRKKKRKSYKKKTPMQKLFESMQNIDITSNRYKREQKMRGFRNAIKKIR